MKKASGRQLLPTGAKMIVRGRARRRLDRLDESDGEVERERNDYRDAEKGNGGIEAGEAGGGHA